MDIAVVDDEAEELAALSQQIASFLGEQALPFRLFPFSGGEALLRAKRPFDLIFLDIRMEGLSGMETAEELRRAGDVSLIVFVTALDEYVYDAFGVEAFDYLLKPVDQDRFRRVMARLCRALRDREIRRLLLPSRGNGGVVLPFRDILYCEAVGHGISVHARGGVHLCTLRMEELESRLDDRFFKCHRSYLVNLEHLRGYGNGLALLDTGERIPVSRLRGREFASKMLQQMKKKDY